MSLAVAASRPLPLLAGHLAAARVGWRAAARPRKLDLFALRGRQWLSQQSHQSQAQHPNPPQNRPQPQNRHRRPKPARDADTHPNFIGENSANNIGLTWPTVASVLLLPVMFAAYAAADFALGNRQLAGNEKLRQQFHAQLNKDDERSLPHRPALFYGVIRKSWGFTHCLGATIQVGDVVEVLEEGVGPDQQYALCRYPAIIVADEAKGSGDGNPPPLADMYGWFPMRWLQKLEHYQATVEKHLLQVEQQHDGTNGHQSTT